MKTALLPLSDDARYTLHLLAECGPQPQQELNQGLADRLLRGALVKSVMLPSPYAKNRGKPIEHVRVTELGRAEARSRQALRARPSVAADCHQKAS